MKSQAGLDTGYPPDTLDAWARTARDWAAGQDPEGAPLVAGSSPAAAPREVFVFFINGAKERAPAAARQLIRRLA
jgi:uncharacterized protein YecE (DUF72 family)